MPLTAHTQTLLDVCNTLLTDAAVEVSTLTRLAEAPAAGDIYAGDRTLRRTVLYLAAQKDDPELLALVFSEEMLPRPQTPEDAWVADSLVRDVSPAAAPYVAALLQRDVERHARTGNAQLAHHLDTLALRDHAAKALAAAGYIGRLRKDIATGLEIIRDAAKDAAQAHRLDMIAAPIARHARAWHAAETLC